MRVWSPVISLTVFYCPTVTASLKERTREKPLKGSRGRKESQLVCLREMMDEVERCDDLAHRSNSQWETTYQWHLFLFLSFFKRNPAFDWEPARTFFRTPFNPPTFFPNHISISVSLRTSEGMLQHTIILSLHYFYSFSRAFCHPVLFSWTVVGGCHCCERGDDWLSGFEAFCVCVVKGGWDLLGKIS